MSSRRASIERFLPVKPAVFHILLALAQSQAHGYGIIQEVRRQSGGRIRLPTGALYRHLRRLLDDGLVDEAGPPPPGDDPRRGVYYRLTPTGRAVIRAEGQRMADLLATTRKLVTGIRQEPA